VPVPGTGGGRSAMPTRIRQSALVILPVALMLFMDVARRWM
jgi:hypothetical protein